MGGNLTLSWAELSVPSGLAALDHRHHAAVVSGAGFAAAGAPSHFVARQSWVWRWGLGLLVLFWPELHSRTALGRRELWASVGLIGGSFLWALGSVLSKRWQSGMDVFSATGWQVTAAGAGTFCSPWQREISRAWRGRRAELSATLYLVVCGSWIGYTAYIWLLEHVPTSKGVDVCVCESRGRGVSGMADSA
jgi:drug/metabolite transporter (DMT)-like permease